MIINLVPRRDDRSITVVKSGDKLTIDGFEADFTDLPDGATIPFGVVPCEWGFGPVHRVDGEIHLILVLPHGPNPAPEVAFPAPITNPADGIISMPGGADVEA